MATDYEKHHGSKTTPQTEPIPGREKDMIENRAGGYVFKAGNWGQLQRFLILGTAGGTYYATEKEMSKDAAKTVIDCVKEDGVRVVDTLHDVSFGGKAYKQDPALYSLALVMAHGDDAAKERAVEKFNEVCRIGTHLFIFLKYATAMRGWGRSLKRIVKGWYGSKDLGALAYQMTKYQAREGWSHRDALRTSHIRAQTPEEAALYGYAVDKVKYNSWEERTEAPFDYLHAIQELQNNPKNVKLAVRVIENYNMPREVIPTELLNEVSVWGALFEKMPATAMIRNLGKMTSIGLLKPMTAEVGMCVGRLSDPVWLRKARIHPIQVLAAMLTYQQGCGMRGSLTWTPVTEIIDALDSAFYATFDNVETTGKRILYGVDVSPSMYGSKIQNVPGLNAGVAAGAMSLILKAREPQSTIMGFSSYLVPIPISPRQRLDGAIEAMKKVGRNWGGTNCALPMKHALNQELEIDAFVIITDSETWKGRLYGTETGHPMEALKEYRQKMGIPAKLSVLGMTATECTVADPDDPGTLDMVGFSTDVPKILNQFIKGEV